MPAPRALARESDEAPEPTLRSGIAVRWVQWMGVRGRYPSRTSALGSSSDQQALYQVAYELGLRTLEDQRDELNGIRTRAGSFMAFVGSATAFLVGTSVQGSSRGGFFLVVAIVATIFSSLAVVCLLSLLRPRRFDFRLSPGVLVDRSMMLPCRDLPWMRSCEAWRTY